MNQDIKWDESSDGSEELGGYMFVEEYSSDSDTYKEATEGLTDEENALEQSLSDGETDDELDEDENNDCEDYDCYDSNNGEERYVRKVEMPLEKGSSYELEYHKNKLQPEKWLFDPITFRSLVKNGFNIMKDLHKYEVFHVVRVATEKGQIDTLRLMIENGLECRKYLKMLYKKGEKELCKRWNGLTAALFSMDDSQTEVVKLFLTAGTDLNPSMESTDEIEVVLRDRPLAIAVRRGLVQISKILIQHGAEVDQHIVKEAGSSLSMEMIEMLMKIIDMDSSSPALYGKFIQGAMKPAGIESLVLPPPRRGKRRKTKVKLITEYKAKLLCFLSHILPMAIKEGFDLNEYLIIYTFGAMSLYKLAGQSRLGYNLQKKVKSLFIEHGFDKKRFNDIHSSLFEHK